jgi:hypothetical protein
MSRKSQLVCQHLENISRTALEQYQPIIRQYVRNRQGVYALYRRQRLYYVGLASSLQGRLKTHLRDRHADSWDRFSVYLTIGDSHLKELESLILRVVKPSGNKQKGKFTRSEDLRHRLKKDFRDAHRAQFDALFCKISNSTQCKMALKSIPAGNNHRKPLLAKYITASMSLRAHFKGKTLKARVSKDGNIHLADKIFTSPSMAAVAAIQGKNCNGWTFWKYQRAPGDWVELDTLRR